MNERRFYAHTLEGQPPECWQPLEDHLRAVAELAARNCEAFDSSDWGYCAGLWHDLGKYQADFQERLLGSRIAVEHSGVGAVLACRKNREIGLPLAFGIAGHHAGLANWAAYDPGLPTPLEERIRGNEPRLKALLASVPTWIQEHPLPSVPAFLRRSAGKRPSDGERRSGEFWTRLLFSALVDADRLNTESFYSPQRLELRRRSCQIATLRQRLDSYIDQKMRALSPDQRRERVNLARKTVLEACRTSASQSPGAFGLNVPTGGGKTLSAMSFALAHAERHGLRRVIVVIPYTSIIEQNAEVYRRALGAENVVEHQSNFDPKRQSATLGEEHTTRLELACENWDAPVIVTTTVQFFESLFSNHPSRCRKLHNVAKSVVILDEVQTLPPAFLLAIVEALNELARHYGCTVVLSTATPPALAARARFKSGLSGIREIIPNVRELADQLKRVEYAWPGGKSTPMEWPALAVELAQHRQVLAVVHRRNDARSLAEELQKVARHGPVWHLSALMCPAHRSDILSQIRNALVRGHTCRVVSTQLVEAGVDLDFPVVYRALAGLDSIVQSAGRCNREGRIEKGRVVLFWSITSPPSGTLRRALQVTDVLLRGAGGELDPTDPELIETYFRMLYLGETLDARGIQTLREGFNFASVGRDFKLIEDGFTESVVVPYGDAEARLQDLGVRGPSRQTLRRLQPFVVNIYPDSFERLSEAGALEEMAGGLFALSNPYKHLYDATFGLSVGDAPQAAPAALVV
jgi:CRISPR-associated endonuclease/helicase Cas3